MIYFSFSKSKNIIIPISLSIIVLSSVVGPLSSYTISKYSQNKRLEKILLNNNMISEERKIKTNSNITQGEKTEISMILKYFKDNHSLDSVKYIPEDFSVNDMEKVFGFAYTTNIRTEESDYFYFDSFDKAQTLDISEYGYLVRINSYLNKATIDESTVVTYDNDNKTLKIKDNDKVIYSKNLEDYILAIYKKHNNIQANGNKSVDIKDTIYVDENENIKVKLMFYHISGNINLSTGGFDTIDVEFIVLINTK